MDDFLVVELQSNADGTRGSLKYQFTDPEKTPEERRALAEQKYHQVLAAAAVSSCELHSAVLLDFSGRLLKREQYTHEVQPEPEAAEEE